MIIENLDEVKKIKQLLGLIQSSTLPPLKGLDALIIAGTCESLFNNCLDFEKKQKEKEVEKTKETENKEIKNDETNEMQREEETNIKTNAKTKRKITTVKTLKDKKRKGRK